MSDWREQARRMAAEARGRHGERQAVAWLEERGYTILGQRLKTPRGEVDIVARRGDLVVFVEVKWRAKAADLDFAIDMRRLSRVAAAAEILMARFAGPQDAISIDVLLLAPGENPRHIANAWMP